MVPSLFQKHASQRRRPLVHPNGSASSSKAAPSPAAWQGAKGGGAKTLAALLALLTLSGCASPLPGERENSSDSAGQDAVQSPETVQQSAVGQKSTAEPQGALPLVTPQEREMDQNSAAALVSFSETLFRQCLKPGENLVLSPLSVTYAMTLLANGAAGETLTALESLNGGISTAWMNETLYTLAKRFSKTEKSVLALANSLWTRKGFELNRSFLSVAEAYYDAEAVSLDFTDDAAVERINQWASKKTDGRISQLLGQISEDTVLLLINTVLFDGVWEEPYPAYSVLPGVFYGTGGETEVDFLHSEEHTAFFLDGGAGFAKDYADGYRFAAILPDEGVDVYEFAQTLDLASVMEQAEGASDTAICAIPKFTSECMVELNDPLCAMGAAEAFRSSADFSGLAENADDLAISNVFQKARIEVTEEGTTAAAATVVAVAETALEAPSVELTFDRPFIYMILAEDTPLFLGVLANP